MLSSRFVSFPFRACLITLGLTALGTAQDPAAAAESNPFAPVCAKMRALSSVDFKTFEEQDAAMTRRFAKMMPASTRETEVRGSWVGKLLAAHIGDDAQEVVVSGDRMIARESDGEWSPRRGVDMFGSSLPFLFDPTVFFDRLAERGAEGTERREESVKWREKDFRVVSATFAGDAARDLVLGGGLPNLRGMGGMIMIGGGARAGGDLPEFTVDIALWIEAETGLCHRVKANAYQESDIPGNVQFQVHGDSEPEEEPEEKVAELDADGKRIYKSGLPVRNVDSSTSAMHFEATLSKHGAAEAPKLDDKARRFLGLGASGAR